MYDVWLQSLHFLRQETYFVPIFFLGSYESAGRQFPNRKQEARISNNGYHNTCSWQNWLASQECLEYGRDFLHLCWAVSQNGIRDFGLIRPNFETQRTNCFFFFFRASRLAPVRALSLQSAGSYHCNCDSTLGYDAGFYPSFVSCTHTVLQVVVVETFFIDTSSMCTKKAHFARQSSETSTKHLHLSMFLSFFLQSEQSRLCWWKRLKCFHCSSLLTDGGTVPKRCCLVQKGRIDRKPNFSVLEEVV